MIRAGKIPSLRLVSNSEVPQKDVTVNVRLFGMLAALTRERLVTLRLPKGSKVEDVVTELGRRFGTGFLDRILRSPGELHSFCQLFVDGEQVDDLAKEIGTSREVAEIGMILLMASEGG